jgi:F420-non-reducing hydrogenase iron-sulfur subunit
MKAIGMDPSRLQMEFCSSAEGQKFQEIATTFHNRIKKLGPNPIKEGSSK